MKERVLRLVYKLKSKLHLTLIVQFTKIHIDHLQRAILSEVGGRFYFSCSLAVLVILFFC